MLNTNVDKTKEIGNRAMITLEEAARVLNININTIELWCDIGLLQSSLSPSNHRTVKRADIITFLPEGDRIISTLMRSNSDPTKIRTEIQQRKKLAEINIQAIIELTKKSVYRISHLCVRPAVASNR